MLVTVDGVNRHVSSIYFFLNCACVCKYHQNLKTWQQKILTVLTKISYHFDVKNEVSLQLNFF